MVENRNLLKEALHVLVKRIKSTDASQMPLKDLVKSSVKYMSNFASTVPDICTAVTLLKVLTNLLPFSEEFLKREWLGPDGQREKGAKFNEHLQIIVKSFIVYSDDPLNAIETIATKAIPELLETDKNGFSATYPTMNRNFLLSIRISDLEMKTFDGRGNRGTCIKYGRFFIEVFLRLGMPLLDHMFKNHRQETLDLLKNVQLSTRALHHMCGHSKKDLALRNNVPMLKRSLEIVVFRVKAMLIVNKCLEAFWVGNLKNRDLRGEEILSQTAASEAGGDSDAETLPDDELSDVELDDESNASNETGENDITDPFI